MHPSRLTMGSPVYPKESSELCSPLPKAVAELAMLGHGRSQRGSRAARARGLTDGTRWVRRATTAPRRCSHASMPLAPSPPPLSHSETAESSPRTLHVTLGAILGGRGRRGARPGQARREEDRHGAGVQVDPLPGHHRHGGSSQRGAELARLPELRADAQVVLQQLRLRLAARRHRRRRDGGQEARESLEGLCPTETQAQTQITAPSLMQACGAPTTTRLQHFIKDVSIFSSNAKIWICRLPPQACAQPAKRSANSTVVATSAASGFACGFAIPAAIPRSEIIRSLKHNLPRTGIPSTTQSSPSSPPALSTATKTTCSGSGHDLLRLVYTYAM